MSYKSGVIDIAGLETLEISDLAAPIEIDGFHGMAGKVTLITNTSAQSVTLKHLSGSPSSRIYSPGGADSVLSPGSGVLVFKVNKGWHVIQSGLGGFGTMAYQNATSVAITGGTAYLSALQVSGSAYVGANTYNGEMMIGALPYGMRLSATPSLNAGVEITNMYDNASSYIAFNARGAGTPVRLVTMQPGQIDFPAAQFNFNAAGLQNSHINYGVNQDTYIRAGLTGSTLYLQDSHNGPVLIGAGTTPTTVRGTLTVGSAGAAGVYATIGGSTEKGYFYSGASKFWMAAEASVLNAWGVYSGAGVGANGNIEAWAGGSSALQVTASQMSISRPVTVTGAVSAFQGRQTIGAFSVDARAGSPAYFVINTKIPFSDGRAPMLRIRGYMYAAAMHVSDFSLMWYVYLGAFSQHQVLHTPGSFAPAVRLDKYNSGGVDYVRIEIENASEYWTQWHVSVEDNFANINDYIGWSVADGAFSAPTAVVVTASTPTNFSVNRSGRTLVYGATGSYFAGTTGLAIGGAAPALCLEGSTTRWLNYVSAGTLLAWYNGSVDRMHLSTAGELSIDFIRPVNATAHVVIGKGAFNALRVTPNADATGVTLSATDSTGAAAYKPITMQGTTVSLIETDSSKSITLTSTGATVNANLAVGGQITISTASAYVGLTSTTGTNLAYLGFINSGGSNFIGAENSAGTGFGASAYDLVAYYTANRAFTLVEAGYGKVARFNRTTFELYFPTVAALRTVLLGAADSGGAGYRVVRVAN